MDLISLVRKYSIRINPQTATTRRKTLHKNSPNILLRGTSWLGFKNIIDIWRNSHTKESAPRYTAHCEICFLLWCCTREFEFENISTHFNNLEIEYATSLADTTRDNKIFCQYWAWITDIATFQRLSILVAVWPIPSKILVRY